MATCPISSLTRGDIVKMKLNTQTTRKNGTHLPSINAAEQELGVTSLAIASPRRHLYWSRKRLMKLRRYADLMQHIKCPVCFDICTPHTMITTCIISEHHMCLSCVVKMLISSQHRFNQHRCPTCQRMLYTKRPSTTLLSLVESILNPDSATANNCVYGNTYQKFIKVNTSLLHQHAPYSYSHLMMFAQLIQLYEGVDALSNILDLSCSYVGLIDKIKWFIDTHPSYFRN